MIPIRRVALALLLVVPAAAQQQPIRSGETITVERILVDTRVTLGDGEPILGLTAKDFRVKVDGQIARVESAEWIPETGVARETAAIDKEVAKTSLETPAPAGRLLIFFFQTDFARNPVRLRGQMKILTYADQIIDGLEPEDRVAVFSYDSHLKFRLDFSDDKEKVRQTMRDSLAIDNPPRPPLVPLPALGRYLEEEAMKGAATPEHALLLIGNALRPIPGPKSLLLFGWGLGRLAGGAVHMDGYYPAAQRALEQSRTSVFSIDITQADWHTLSVGLSQAAADTGGFYAETYTFPRLAVERLQRTLQGHYELEVVRPENSTLGVHTIDVEVIGHRGAVVLSRRSFVDR